MGWVPAHDDIDANHEKMCGLTDKPVAALLTLFLAISGVVGFFFMPNTVGKSLEQIETERA